MLAAQSHKFQVGGGRKDGGERITANGKKMHSCNYVHIYNFISNPVNLMRMIMRMRQMGIFRNKL